MPRYAPRSRRSRACYDDPAEWPTEEIRQGSINVHEPESEPEETGLYDHLGNELMRLPEPCRPIGFLANLDEDD